MSSFCLWEHSDGTERTAGLHLQRLYGQPLTEQLFGFVSRAIRVKFADTFDEKFDFFFSRGRTTTEIHRDRTMRSALGLCVLGLLCLHNLVMGEVRDLVGMNCLDFHTNTKPYYRNERNCTEGIKALWSFIVSTVYVVGRSITMLVGLIKYSLIISLVLNF